MRGGLGVAGARLPTMDLTKILLVVLAAALTFLGAMILSQLQAIEDDAREDREARRLEHGRMVEAVSGLQTEVSDLKAAVEVLLDRSGRKPQPATLATD